MSSGRGGTGSRESPCTSSSTSSSLVSPSSSSADNHRVARQQSGTTPSWRNSAASFSSLGPDAQSLLCTESLSSSTPPSDDSQRLSQDQDAQLWTKSDLLKNRKATGIQYALIVPNDHANKLSGNKVHLQHIQIAVADKENSAENSVILDGRQCNNDSHAENRMNSNGFERARMTGGTPSTNENLVWLADVAVSQNQAQSRPAEGMISGRSSQNQGQGQSQTQTQESQQTMLSAGASVGSVFRPSLNDPSQRGLAGGQYLAGGSASSLGQYSSLYSVHGQPSHLAAASVPQFSAFYHQYPQGYSHGSAAVLAGHYPHIESYSAVLASMGSHVQHGGHAQLPRSPFMPSGHVPQYSVMGGSHRTLGSASSPGPNPNPHHQAGSSHQTASLSGAESLVSPKTESQGEGEGRGHRSGSTSSLRDEKGSNLSPSMGHSSLKGLHVRESPKGFIDKDFYKVPSGKEGSLKHRILTRPQDNQPEGMHIEDSKYALHVKSEEPLVKRTKYSSFSGLPSSHSHPAHSRSAESVSHGLGPGPPNSQPSPIPQTAYPPSHLHYPPHFMKGSIIQLANGELKRVEDLQTDDFVNSADISPDLKIDSSTVVRIQEQPERGTAILGFSVGEHRVQVTVEATMEHPFFVFGRGWSSCSAERTLHRYGLDCHKLSVGDVCISLTHKDVPLKAAEISQQQSQSEAHQEMTSTDKPPQGHSVTFSDTVVTTHLQSSSSRSPAYPGTLQTSDSESDSHHRKRRWSAPDQVSVDSDSESQSKPEDIKPELDD